MIQLSDTKAAPGLGGMLGIKPKAGGDSSAFALALGGLVADAGPDMPIALTRQSTAAPGKDLPQDGADDAEGEGQLDWDIQSIALPDVIVLPFESPATRSPDAPEPAPAPATMPLSTDLAERETESGVTGKPSPPFIVEPSDAATVAPANPQAEPGANIEITPSTTDASPPVAKAAKPRRQAVDMDSRSHPQTPETRVPTSPVDANGETASTIAAAIIHRAASAPTATISSASLPQRMAGSSDKANPPPPRPAIPDATTAASSVATAVSATAILSPARGDAASIGRGAVSARFEPSAVVARSPDAAAAGRPAIPDAATAASSGDTAVSTTATPPLARGDAASIGRGAVSARFEPAAVVPKSPDAAVAGKAGVEPTPPSGASPAVTVAIKAEALPAMPAKFVIADRPVDAPSPAVPRRIPVTPVVAPAALTAATTMTAADLIPATLRPRAAAVPVVTVTDPASVGLSAPVATASPAAEPAPIDTHAAKWIEGMIEQIEVLRDARADGASATTRIRLSPDALGAVEIVLVGEGEAIEVRINADTAAARTLLAEAAPRLTDMAEARGLKLAQGDAGQPGQHHAQRQQHQDQPTANHRRHDAADPRGSTDERIA
jgi:flagellar hook-length control protein FliK